MRRAAYVLAGLIAAATGTAAWAADVALKVSTREAYVNEPVSVEVMVINADRHDPPHFPDLPNAKVELVGRSGPNISLHAVQGRMSQQVSWSYTFRVTPQRRGRIEIPPIPVRVDGKILKTAATTILVTGSETGDLLFVELASDRESIYLGEAIEVDLEIWLRPYRDRSVRDGLSPGDMLSQISFDHSQWGGFHDTIIRLRNRDLKWQYRPDTRVDAQGNERAYYVFPVPLKFVPTTTGPLDVGQISVVVAYPTRRGRSNDIFSIFDRYQITQTRPVQASLGEPNILVKPLPTADQPAYFNGAVGRYGLAVEAGRTQVRVREPIEVTLTITGSGVLERVPPPPLAEVEALTRDFKVPDEILSGIVADGRKRFTVKIGAKNADVTEIPAIPFSFFDPQSEQYLTRWSDPIPLEVKASEQVSVSQFAETAEAGPAGATELTETAAGIRANYVDMDEVLAQQIFTPGWGSAVLLVLSPTAYVFCVALRRHRERLAHDQGYVQRRRAGPTALSAIRRAGFAENAADAAAGVGNALIRYISDRCNAPAGLTRIEALEQLNRRGLPQDRVRSLAALLERCEGLQYAGADSEMPMDLPTEARRCVQTLERERF